MTKPGAGQGVRVSRLLSFLEPKYRYGVLRTRKKEILWQKN